MSLAPHKQDASNLSTISGVTGTDLSRRTEKTSYSIPEDGRAITIPAPTGKKAGAAGARIAQTSRTSLMIEFFEGAGDPESGRRPSLRVKVAPSNRSKGGSGGGGIQLIDSTKANSRRTERGAPIRSSLSPRIPEENRLMLGDEFGNRRRKSSTGEDGSIASYRSNDEIEPLKYSNYGRVSSPLANDISREIELGSDVARARTRANRSASRSKNDPLFGSPGGRSPGGRSRSVSRESYLDDGRKLAKRRSRSLSRDRLGDKLDPNGKPRKGVNRGYEPKAIRGKSRSISQERSQTEDPKRADSKETYDPQLLELIEDAIKRVVQPQLAELRKQQNSAQFEQKMKDISSQVSGMLPPKLQQGKSNSMPDVHSPMVVLQPDFDRGKGQGFVVAGGKDHDVGSDPLPLFYKKRLQSGGERSIADSNFEKAESTISRGLGHGLMPGDRAYSPTGTRASIMTARTSGHPPYPSGGYGAGMPGTGHTPPPDSVLSMSSFGGRRARMAPLEVGDDPRSLDVDDYVGGEKPSDALSIADLSDTPSTKLARSRRQDKNRRLSIGYTNDGDHSVIDSDDGVGNHQSNSAVEYYFLEQREKMQDKALQSHAQMIEAHLAQSQPGILGSDLDYNHLEKGQRVIDVGANPQYCPTPNLAPQSTKASMVAGDAASARSSVHPQVHLSANAMPRGTSPMPDVEHVLDDDEITNPSIIQGPGPGKFEIKDWRYGGVHDQEENHDLSNLGTNNPTNVNNMNNLGSMDRGGLLEKPSMEHSSHTPNKDEGYISAAPNVFGTGMAPSPAMTPVPGLSGLEGFTDMMTTVQNVDYPYRGHQRLSSGNSHGMPSPLYDSATGRGIDKIQDKDIVALMDHLTVRDAQRNARDTEILVSLVRSAAEMRNYFEDIKRQLDEQTKDIVHQVDQNTEKTVHKLQGPRPLPPSAPRTRRAIEEAEDEHNKRKNIFRRALKGLSSSSSKDLTRIEDMLETLLQEVDGLKADQSFYQQSMMGTVNTITNTNATATATASPMAVAAAPHIPTQTLHTQPAITNDVPDLPSTTLPYSTNVWHQRNISPIAEALTPTPTNPNPEGLQQETPRELPKSVEATPEKKRESDATTVPKQSRWSETTASSGFRSFFSRKNRDSQQTQNELHYDPEDVPPLPQMPAASQNPPSSRGTDAPLNQANRMSLEIKHPQPRIPYNHQLEQQAQQIPPLIPSYNNSTSTLGMRGQYGNPTPAGAAMTPSALTDGYAPSGADTMPIPKMPRTDDESTRDSFHSGDTTERLRKKKDKNDPERVARREKRRAERAERDRLEGKDPNRPRRPKKRESVEPTEVHTQHMLPS